MTAMIDDAGEVPRHDVPRGGRSGFTRVEDRQVHYLEWGRADAPAVVCLHGGGQTAYMYEDLGAHLRDRAHVVAPDLPGHGDSDGFEGGTGPPAIAAAVFALVAEFGFERLALVGASLGGLASIHAAAAEPERVSALVLIDIGHRLEPEGVRRIVDFMVRHESFASLEEAAAEIAAHLPHRREVRVESLTRNLRQRRDGRWEWKHSFGRRFRDRPTGEPHPADSLDQFLAGLDQRAAAVECPTLVLRGTESDVLSDEGAEAVAELIPGARLERIERAGHLAAGDNPRSTLDAITAFLADTGSIAVPTGPIRRTR